MVKGAGPLPEKNHFAPKIDKFGCIWKFLTQFLTGQKHGQSLEALHGTQILLFNRKTKLTKQCKNYPKIQSDQGGGGSRTIAPVRYPSHCAYWYFTAGN